MILHSTISSILQLLLFIPLVLTLPIPQLPVKLLTEAVSTVAERATTKQNPLELSKLFKSTGQDAIKIPEYELKRLNLAETISNRQKDKALLATQTRLKEETRIERGNYWLWNTRESFSKNIDKYLTPNSLVMIFPGLLLPIYIDHKNKNKRKEQIKMKIEAEQRRQDIQRAQMGSVSQFSNK